MLNDIHEEVNITFDELMKIKNVDALSTKHEFLIVFNITKTRFDCRYYDNVRGFFTVNSNRFYMKSTVNLTSFDFYGVTNDDKRPFNQIIKDPLVKEIFDHKKSFSDKADKKLLFALIKTIIGDISYNFKETFYVSGKTLLYLFDDTLDFPPSIDFFAVSNDPIDYSIKYSKNRTILETDDLMISYNEIHSVKKARQDGKINLLFNGFEVNFCVNILYFGSEYEIHEHTKKQEYDILRFVVDVENFMKYNSDELDDDVFKRVLSKIPESIKRKVEERKIKYIPTTIDNYFSKKGRVVIPIEKINDLYEYAKQSFTITVNDKKIENLYEYIEHFDSEFETIVNKLILLSKIDLNAKVIASNLYDKLYKKLYSGLESFENLVEKSKVNSTLSSSNIESTFIEHNDTFIKIGKKIIDYVEVKKNLNLQEDLSDDEFFSDALDISEGIKNYNITKLFDKHYLLLVKNKSMAKLIDVVIPTVKWVNNIIRNRDMFISGGYAAHLINNKLPIHDIDIYFNEFLEASLNIEKLLLYLNKGEENEDNMKYYVNASKRYSVSDDISYILTFYIGTDVILKHHNTISDHTKHYLNHPTFFERIDEKKNIDKKQNLSRFSLFKVQFIATRNDPIKYIQSFDFGASKCIFSLGESESYSNHSKRESELAVKNMITSYTPTEKNLNVDDDGNVISLTLSSAVRLFKYYVRGFQIERSALDYFLPKNIVVSNKKDYLEFDDIMDIIVRSSISNKENIDKYDENIGEIFVTKDIINVKDSYFIMLFFELLEIELCF